LSILDLDKPNTPIFEAQAHASIINCMDGIGGLQTGYGAPEIVTGGRDGCVRVWDPRTNVPVLSLEPEEGQTARDCWSVSFGNSYNDEDRVVAAGYDNGDVKIFDLRTNTLRYETNLKNGVTNLSFDRPDIEMNKLLTTTLESKFTLMDLRTQHPEEGFAKLTERAHKSTVWLGKHLPQNRDLFMTGGGNGGFNIYKYHYPSSGRTAEHPKDKSPIGVIGSVELLNSRVISTQPVVSFDWSPDREGLCCLSCLDQSLRVYIVTKLNKY
jgi:WD40 repeat protein